MRVRFEYDALKVVNGQYMNGQPCDYGGGPSPQNKTCGWWAGRFRLLFKTGPNRDRSLARILGFDAREDYDSSVSQHSGGSYGDMNPTSDADEHPDLRGDKGTPAVLEAPYPYYTFFGPQAPPEPSLVPGRENRPPTITLPFKARPDYVSVGVPPNSMQGRCHTRDSGVSYVTAGLGRELNVNVGIGTILNRFLVLEPGDVSIRGYAFERAFVPDPEKAQVTYEWDHAVLVTGLEVSNSRHGLVEIEGYVGGLASPSLGQYDDQDWNMGWTSIGLARGSSGEGPFNEGNRSLFTWPSNDLSGAYFRFVIRRVSHQKRWAVYRAFPVYTSRAKHVLGLDVPPRFVSVYAGVENWLRGIQVDDTDIGLDAVQGYASDVRRVRVTVSCSRGELFVSAPYTDTVSA
eukprot:CAMPEP_0174935882 /NCGR_PEP_ID=MMETSP1355-20121228/55289_1 /TAXON_ID=464990 /ORGANISM="Hemiselmis tepida, Strain CCMP443" /LENGTH=401 /DNA_ID=CAMNT_0016182615 /DNA_START=7 /DNA_END=1209 /DNA_ORIENTATION=-